MVFLNQHCVGQIFILLVVSVIFQVMMVISNPMTDKCDQRITLIIEISVSIYLYVLLSLTDFMGDSTVRNELGWVLTILTGIVVAVIVSVFFWKTLWRAVAYVKQLYERLYI